MSSLLPPNATAQERALEGAMARIDDISVPLRSLWNPWACPEALLPWLAWTVSLDLWDSTWSAQVKRAVIADAIKLHRIKGTPGAVELALIITGAPNARVVEWFEYGGSPGYFRVEIDLLGVSVSIELQEKILRTIQAFKNRRSWLDRVHYIYPVTGQLYTAAAVHASALVTINPWRQTEASVDGPIYFGGALQLIEGITIYPQL